MPGTKPSILSISLAALALWGAAAVAQPVEPGDQEEVIDEVTVIGQKTMLVLRNEALQAEERFLNSYNELNTNDKLDIVCVDAAPIGSRIVRRTCLPQYRWDERSNESASFLRNVGAVAPTTEITVMPTDTELLENLQTLARENPELLDSLMDFQDKLATLNAAQQSGSDEE